jgi:hypothetical protein
MTPDLVDDMDRERADYVSYMLRLWRAGEDVVKCDEEQALWRASLENAHTGERRGFANLEELFDFLREHTGAASEPKDGDN